MVIKFKRKKKKKKKNNYSGRCDIASFATNEAGEKSCRFGRFD